MGKGKKRRHQPLAVEVRSGPTELIVRVPSSHPKTPSLIHSNPYIIQLDEDVREQREMELKRKRMLRRRTDGQGDDDGGRGEEEEAAAMLGEGAGGQVSSVSQA